METNKKPVIVLADESGNVVITSSKNPEYGHIRVSQVRIVIDDTGFAKPVKIYALIPGLVNDLKEFGWNEGDKVDGKIIIKEQLTPFNPKDPGRDIKVAGKEGVVCKVGDKPIYRKNFFTLNKNAEDILKQHTNVDEIKMQFSKLPQNDQFLDKM